MYPKIKSRYDFDVFIEGILCDIPLICDYSEDFLESLISLDGSFSPILLKKVKKILLNPNEGKYLKSNLKGWKEVRVAKKYRLYFKLNKEKNLITIQNFSHKKYQKKLNLNT